MKRSVILVFVFVLVLTLPGCMIALVGTAQQAFKSERPAVAEDQRLADLGHSALSGGSYGLAEAYLTEALEANPANPYALHDLGIVYYSTNRSDEARVLYAKFASLDPPAADIGRGVAVRRTPTELVRR
jgi:Flp pilus assembly protein TadD